MNDDDDIDGLAGEYVLGALTPDERAAVVRRMATDAHLAAEVTAWERRLGPLSSRIAPVEPPQKTLGDILARIDRPDAASGSQAEIIVLRRQIKRWRWIAGSLAAGVAVVAIALASGLAGRYAFTPAPEFAVLVPQRPSATADEPIAAMSVVLKASLDRRSRELTILQLAGSRPPSGRQFVVWIEGAPGTSPQALGRLTADAAGAKFRVPNQALAGTQSHRILVSLETEGRNGLDRPRGPLIAAGTFGK